MRRRKQRLRNRPRPTRLTARKDWLGPRKKLRNKPKKKLMILIKYKRGAKPGSARRERSRRKREIWLKRSASASNR